MYLSTTPLQRVAEPLLLIVEVLQRTAEPLQPIVKALQRPAEPPQRIVEALQRAAKPLHRVVTLEHYGVWWQNAVVSSQMPGLQAQTSQVFSMK